MKNLELPEGQYAIFGSAPMGIRGLRECRDLDVIVTEEIFEDYKGKFGWELKKFERDGRHVEMVEKNNIEFYKDWGPGDWNVKELIKDAEVINDLPFVKLEQVIKWKKISAREKDLADVQLIQNFLEKN